jgi:hypothetical protein
LASSWLRVPVAAALAVAGVVLAAVVVDDEPSPEPGPARTAGPFPSGSRLLFGGDFDTGDLSQWGVVHSEAADRVTVGMSGPSPREGGYRGRFEVRPGDVGSDSGNRAEVTAPRPGGWFAEGQERWIRQAVYVPSQTLERRWRQVTQYSANGVGSPAVALFLVGGTRPRFEVRHGDSSTTDWVGPTLRFDRWYDIAVHMRYSSNRSSGFIEIYLDGVRQKLTNRRTRRYRTTREHGKAYLKVGLYRDAAHSTTNVVYHDNVRVHGPKRAGARRAGAGDARQAAESTSARTSGAT